jgi:hypothetical protein
MKPEIIFINWGNPYYLKYTLSQCKGYNRNLKINLLGDASSIGYRGVHHFFFADYMTNANQFEKMYEHYNTNFYKFELFCIQRWMIINEFIKEKNIEKCLILDSDVLLYYNIADDFDLLKPYKMSLCLHDDGETAFASICHILDRTILDEFVNFCFEIYSDKQGNNFQKLLAHYNNMQSKNQPGGICDMNIWNLFYNDHKKDIVDLETLDDKYYYDQNINFPVCRGENVLFENGVKKIFFEKGIPFTKTAKDNKKIIFKQLHFQGEAKKNMQDYVTYKGFYYWYNDQWITFKNSTKAKVKKFLSKRPE